MEDLNSFFSRHKRVALSFSAGKDSAACLWLLQPWWDKLTVVWCDGGNPREEALLYMMGIASIVPHFDFVRGDQVNWTAQNGMPVDVLPFELSRLGRISTGSPGPWLSLAGDCCRANLWEPLYKFLKEREFTAVIRGQRNSDELRSPVTSGEVVDGVEYLYPIQDWSDADVVAFLGPRLPANYSRGLRSSLDCKNCTAYQREHAGLAEDLERCGDPQAAAQVRSVHNLLRTHLEKHLKLMEM